MDERASTFQQHKPKLCSAADAEDILQDAYLGWHQADADRLQIPEAWLTTVVTRPCTDRLRASRSEREAYLGPRHPGQKRGRVPPDRTSRQHPCAQRSAAILSTTGDAGEAVGEIQSYASSETDGTRIFAVYSVLNPDKLRGVAPPAGYRH
jgi:DNA-directed RNA polymerase specialized sigma24 family protein